MAEPSNPTNRMAIVSLCSAVLTLLSFCIGFAPFLPMTAGICYPLALVLSVVALVTGVLALRQLRSRPENGRWMALTGTILGGVLPLVIICATIITISALAVGLTELFKQANP